MKCLYVGNLPRECTEEDLRALFEGHDLETVTLVLDRRTGRSRGFAFVEMTSDEGATAALESLRGTEMSGRPLKVGNAFKDKNAEVSKPGGYEDYGNYRPRRGRRGSR